VKANPAAETEISLISNEDRIPEQLGDNRSPGASNNILRKYSCVFEFLYTT
jgi:hypothetical protein